MEEKRNDEKMKLFLEQFNVPYMQDNSLINYLNYWKIKKTVKTRIEIDKMWLADEKEKYNADTIFSLWMPLKMCLQSFNPDKFGKELKTNKLCRSVEHYDDLLENLDTYLPLNDELTIKLKEFSDLASTRENVMDLPEGKMNKRGIFYYDEMPITLKQCFKGGKFSKFFDNNDEKVKEWVEDQKLQMFFTDGIIDEEHIKSIGPLTKDCAKWITDKEELKIILQEYIDLLKLRKQEINK